MLLWPMCWWSAQCCNTAIVPHHWSQFSHWSHKMSSHIVMLLFQLILLVLFASPILHCKKNINDSLLVCCFFDCLTFVTFKATKVFQINPKTIRINIISKKWFWPPVRINSSTEYLCLISDQNKWNVILTMWQIFSKAQVKSFHLANCEIYVKLKFVEQKQIQRILTIDCVPINIGLFQKKVNSHTFSISKILQ